MIKRGVFIEWAEVHGAFYGTSGIRLKEIMEAGNDVILDIDTQGAMQIREKYREAVTIFILPPSMELLKERLEKRMTDSQEEMKKRLKTAIAEIKTYSRYDYVIINNIFEKALKEFEAIIISHRVKTRMINPLWIKESFF
jgi:guanylate kinase